MNAERDPIPPQEAAANRRPWLPPTVFAFTGALVILASGTCCWSPLVNLALPVPSCMGGYGSAHADAVRTMVFFDLVAMVVSFPFALILAALCGLGLYLALRASRSGRFIQWTAAVAGGLIGLAFGLLVPVIVSRTMCNL